MTDLYRPSGRYQSIDIFVTMHSPSYNFDFTFSRQWLIVDKGRDCSFRGSLKHHTLAVRMEPREYGSSIRDMTGYFIHSHKQAHSMRSRRSRFYRITNLDHLRPGENGRHHAHLPRKSLSLPSNDWRKSDMAAKVHKAGGHSCEVVDVNHRCKTTRKVEGAVLNAGLYFVISCHTSPLVVGALPRRHCMYNLREIKWPLGSHCSQLSPSRSASAYNPSNAFDSFSFPISPRLRI